MCEPKINRPKRFTSTVSDRGTLIDSISDRDFLQKFWFKINSPSILAHSRLTPYHLSRPSSSVSFLNDPNQMKNLKAFQWNVSWNISYRECAINSTADEISPHSQKSSKSFELKPNLRRFDWIIECIVICIRSRAKFNWLKGSVAGVLWICWTLVLSRSSPDDANYFVDFPQTHRRSQCLCSSKSWRILKNQILHSTVTAVDVISFKSKFSTNGVPEADSLQKIPRTLHGSDSNQKKFPAEWHLENAVSSHRRFLANLMESVWTPHCGVHSGDHSGVHTHN